MRWMTWIVLLTCCAGGGLFCCGTQPGAKVPEDRTPRPQSPYYRGRILDTEGYLSFHGSAPGGVISDASGKALRAGKLCTVDDPNKCLEFKLAVEEDPCIKDEKSPGLIASVRLYTLEVNGKNVCDEPYGYADRDDGYGQVSKEEIDKCGGPEASCSIEHTAMAIPGRWVDSTGQYEPDAKGVITLACITGAAAKCIHWGYVPWKRDYGSGEVELLPYYRACVHAARADYDGVSFQTCQGAEIDIYDNLGIQNKAPDAGIVREEESAWTGEGKLVALKRPRYPDCNVICDEQHRQYCPDKWSSGILWVDSMPNVKPPSQNRECPKPGSHACEWRNDDANAPKPRDCPKR